jgi:hypothetical protein
LHAGDAATDNQDRSFDIFRHGFSPATARIERLDHRRLRTGRQFLAILFLLM